MSAYTIGRLRRVADAFVATDPQPVKEPTIEDIFSCPPAYDLRPRVRKPNSRPPVLYTDDDDTDDYDPSEDQTPRKRKPSSNVTGHGSPRARKKAKSTTKDFGALQRELVDVALIQSRVPDIVPSVLDGYNFRPRTRPSVSSERTIDNTANHAHTSSSSTSLPNECLACLELGLECSLEQEPFSYPCANCRDDSIECVPNPPPTWKRPCEQCKGRHRSHHCSYNNYDYDHSKPCQHCHDRGFDCVAGPAKYHQSMVHTDGRDTEKLLSLQGTILSSSSEAIDACGLATTREFTTINSPKLTNSFHTAAESTRSSPVDLGESGPWALLNCDATTGEHARSSPTEAGNIELSLGNNHTSLFSGQIPASAMTFFKYPKFDFEDGPKPTVKRTELPHPLKVNHDPSAGGETCHWYDNFAYGISGLGVRYPTVIETIAGEWVEIEDGHAHEARDPSRMCVQCTFKRVSVLLCSHGSIVRLEDSEDADVDAAYAELNKATKALHPRYKTPDDNFKEPLQTWCSLCRAPAFWRCNEDHPITREDTLSTIPTDPGCGLHLCDYCASLTTQYHGDLEAVVAYGANDPQNATDFRADVEYILKHSENNVFWQQLCGKI